MTYLLLEYLNDEDIPHIISIYNTPLISQFISIDKNNYWKYVVFTDNVYFYKVYNDGNFVATIHLELYGRILYMSVVVFPEYQKQGIATTILEDIQTGKIGLDFDKIQVSIDEKNLASLKLFANAGFVCISKDEELFEYEYIKS